MWRVGFAWTGLGWFSFLSYPESQWDGYLWRTLLAKIDSSYVHVNVNMSCTGCAQLFRMIQGEIPNTSSLFGVVFSYRLGQCFVFSNAHNFLSFPHIRENLLILSEGKIQWQPLLWGVVGSYKHLTFLRSFSASSTHSHHFIRFIEFITQGILQGLIQFCWYPKRLQWNYNS